MFFNKKRISYPNPNSLTNNPYNYQENSMPNYYDIERLKTEINEIRRNQTEMLNRIVRMENYLGVRNELNPNQSIRPNQPY